MNLYELTKKICLFLLTFFIIDFSPQILNQIQPDSGDYLNLHPARQTTYYIAIQVLKTLKIDLIFFQKFFLSFSICILFFSIKKKTNIFLCLAAYILILSNIYYTSFSKTILTESFLFSFINLAIAFLFELRKRFNLFFFALCCGIISSLKPIGIPFALILITLAIIQLKKINQVFLIILVFLIPNIIENLFFYSHFDKRETVFKHSVAGKLFILSGKDSFKISDYPENLHELLVVSKKEFKPIHQFLDDIDNIFLRSELLSDYEVVAQYQTFNFQSVKNKFEEKIIFENYSKIFFQILKNNLSDYLMLSLYHYLGNWSIGSKVRFLEKNKKEIPKFQELEKSSGPMNIPSLPLIHLAQYFFIILFFILTLYSLFIILWFCGIINRKLNLELFSLVFLVQSYLILISVTNVSTPRYLMPIYPIVIIVAIEFVKLFNKKNKINS